MYQIENYSNKHIHVYKIKLCNVWYAKSILDCSYDFQNRKITAFSFFFKSFDFKFRWRKFGQYRRAEMNSFNLFSIFIEVYSMTIFFCLFIHFLFFFFKWVYSCSAPPNWSFWRQHCRFGSRSFVRCHCCSCRHSFNHEVRFLVSE